MTRIAIIVGSKGRGSNMRAIVEACQSGVLDAKIACVIAPSEDAPAVETALSLGAEVVIPADMDADLLGILQERDIDLVCLAGFMRLIPVDVVRHFERRMLNIHPALLPKFGGKGMWGMKVHEAVIAAGETESGCTVHYVSEKYDEGAILHQLRCPVKSDDMPESLASRVLELEHRGYVEAIRKWTLR
ncbi:MAG: phosphoribosylglycinamide formyltransferase [Fimbriimonadales bacterium]